MNKTIDAQQAQNKDTLLIRRKEVPVVTKTLLQGTLKFFVDNPRIYSALRKQGDVEPSQEEIQDKLLQMDHVKELIQDIKLDGGLTDPVIVRDGTLEVLEGNSRLAAYRYLARLDPVKWGEIKVRLLPKDIDDKLVLALLGQYHLKGKTAWAPFEKAGFLYRRHKDQNIPVDELALEVGETKQKVAHMVKVHQFMLENNQYQKERWSYYDEYLKSRIVKKVRDKGFDELIVNKINKGEINRATDVRDILPLICKAPKALKKFKAGEYDFNEAHDSAKIAGADDAAYKRLEKFRKWLVSTETEEELNKPGGEVRNGIKYELKKLGQRVEELRRRLY